MPDPVLSHRLDQAVTDLEHALVALSLDLHAHPELSLQEIRSSDRLRRLLEAEGFRVETGTAGLPTAFIARRSGTGPGPRVAFLAEYDALPGIGHACGHNLIAAAGTGAGMALGRLMDTLAGEVLVMGTPAEETLGGKCLMVREGCFRDVDAALMVHPGSEWRVQTDSLACISLEVVFTGREAHAVAWPEKGINALDALIQLFIAVEMMRKRMGSGVRLPGVILEGGTRPNIVPARAVGHFSLRAPDSPARDRVREEFERTARGIAAATGCAVHVQPTDEPYDDMVTSSTLAALFEAHLRSLGVEPVTGPRPNKGSLDMGNVSRVVPSLHPFMAICDPGVPSHSEAFARAAASPRAATAMIAAVRSLARTGLDLLCDPSVARRAREELAALGAPRG
ncbi:MAG TPA: amidohydrolase [Candidatus Polarisedimenticolia bacterium]|nr:amidohydrolase [Candidatus Polarisedimenticolia bacterium]